MGTTGCTVGVEEEFHVVDAETLAVRDEPALTARLLDGAWGAQVHAEISTTQIEVTTSVCRTLGEVRAALVAGRRLAREACGAAGATVLPASTHPWHRWTEQRLTPSPRYLDLLERWGLMALQQTICGCHVHVGVADVDTAVAVMDRVRPWLPVLLAMTGSSPFHEGHDTGHESWRTTWWSRWPVAGTPEPLGDADGYRRVVDRLVETGAVADAHGLYWDVRPSLRWPTLEYRLADVCTRVDDAVLHAALVAALTRTLARAAVAGSAPAEERPEVARAGRWAAARLGLRAALPHPVSGAVVPAVDVVEDLLALLRPDLEDRGEWCEVRALADQLLRDGTSARRQREAVHRSGQLAEAARWAVRAGAAG